jgi:Spy/CpxP family protein refolding chaperone
MSVTRSNRLLAIGGVLVLVLGLASAAAVLAQTRGGSSRSSLGAGFGFGRAMRLTRLARLLDITAQQKQEIKDIVTAHKPEIKHLVDSGFAARKALRQAVAANDSRAIADAVGQLSNVERDGATLKAQLRTQIFGSVLTTDQRAKAAQLLSEFEQKAEARRQRIDQFLDRF